MTFWSPQGLGANLADAAADSLLEVSYNRERNEEESPVAPRCDSILISLILLFATATGAQEVSSNKGAELRDAGGKKETKAPEVSGKKAAAGAQSSGVAKRSAERPDFKVLVWYRRDDPLGTFKCEVYDVRKGEYTTAVDAWVRNIETSYPAYLVVVRGVDLKRERGETEKLKVGSVIKRELIVAAGMSGVFLDGGASLSPETKFWERVARRVRQPAWDRSIDRLVLPGSIEATSIPCPPHSQCRFPIPGPIPSLIIAFSGFAEFARLSIHR